MHKYRCYLLNTAHRIFDFREVAGASDEDAKAQASSLVGQVRGASVELWDRDRLVAVFVR